MQRLPGALVGADDAPLPCPSSIALSLGTTSANPGRPAGASAQQSLHACIPRRARRQWLLKTWLCIRTRTRHPCMHHKPAARRSLPAACCAKQARAQVPG